MNWEWVEFGGTFLDLLEIIEPGCHDSAKDEQWVYVSLSGYYIEFKGGHGKILFGTDDLDSTCSLYFDKKGWKGDVSTTGCGCCADCGVNITETVVRYAKVIDE